MDTSPESIFLALLREPTSAIGYAASARITAARRGRYVLESDEWIFDPYAHAAAGHARVAARAEVHDQWDHGWEGPDEPITRSLKCAWLDVTWNSHSLEVVRLAYEGAHSPKRLHFVVADSADLAREYFEVVCRHCAEVRDEVLVFANGCWNKSKELYAAVRSTSWSDVVLAEGLAARIRADFDRFVAAREQFQRWGIPWKRGALFLGPPGNGKTMCIKALVHHLGLPCLYVQSFVAPRAPEQVSIREVFERARRTAPCVMVLEDLDSLVTPGARSFFLNELDGFASNTGLLTIGSTNHPERLDPAIVDRPSRFDRKYHFDLPGERERGLYVQLWNARLAAELRLDEPATAAIVAATIDYSFAYLKELFAASLMRFASADARDQELGSVVLEEAEALRKQMATSEIVPEIDSSTVPQETDPFGAAHRRQMRRYGL